FFAAFRLPDSLAIPAEVAPAWEKTAAHIVPGARHGVSCALQFVEAARLFLVARGFAVEINEPYAGGFTTGHYGRPSVQRHALQIEVNRALYMNERDYQRKDYFPRLVQDLAELVHHLGRVAQRCLARPA